MASFLCFYFGSANLPLAPLWIRVRCVSGALALPDQGRRKFQQYAEQIRQLAAQFQLGLVDSLAAFEEYQNKSSDLSDLLSWSNHPNRAGHELVARDLLRWFPME